MNVTFKGQQLENRPDLLLKTLSQLGARNSDASTPVPDPESSRVLEKRLLEAVGPDRLSEAQSVIETGRLSWRLRDDDNMLVGRLENELLRVLRIAVGQLGEGGRIDADATVTSKAAPLLVEALRNSDGEKVLLPSQSHEEHPALSPGGTARQLVGQPAAPGYAAGPVRMIFEPDDLGNFRSGEVLVCDAVQPTMTHLVPLASAIVERRGGMLIHGAIIARELGIPSVNGVGDLLEVLHNGELVTVDGYLGIVTVGSPEFDLEVPSGFTS